MRPNIFDISTKELSQDAFITWLLLWADSAQATTDENLHNCAKAFIKALIKTQIPDFNGGITNVKAGRQWEDIDVWAKVNNEYLIIIEDKTNTGQHSGQLEKYKTFAEKWCEEQSPKYKAPICIYLKTGNESMQSLGYVIGQGFNIYSRQDFLKLLQHHDSENNIFKDFKERLQRIEQSHKQWENKIIKDWGWNDWQGFFMHLEEKDLLINWHHVNNPNGGFWNAVLSWDYWGEYPVYLQTEQEKLCFKISTDPKEINLQKDFNRKDKRNEISQLILSAAEEKGYTHVERPNRYGHGKYMTVAVVEGIHWLGNKEEKINVGEVVRILEVYKTFLRKLLQRETGAND